MPINNINHTFLKYVIVGIFSAAIHGIVLVVLSQALPLSISNLFAFLTASISSYLGHALFTFRKETQGKKFARRWLLIQYFINISISALLPIFIESYLPKASTQIILVLTPTLINCIIWLKAKNHSLQRANSNKTTPIIHADDFGLNEATNKAIIDLKKLNVLSSTSLIINGNSVESAIKSWKELTNFPLCLHLCITEGPATGNINEIKNISNQNGGLSKSFFELILISCLPKNNTYRKLIKLELKHEIISQIEKYKRLTELEILYIDGHQHIHLIPIVMEVLIDLRKQFKIRWIRTTSEPLITSISIKSWYMAFIKKGILKWLILRILSYFAKKRIKQNSIQTNSAFSGVLFTGIMSENIIIAASKELKLTTIKNNETAPLILTHPSYPLANKEERNRLLNFHLSSKFFNSKWRYREFQAIQKLKK